jgi:cytoskeletal protein CcmA (bactofilin family)
MISDTAHLAVPQSEKEIAEFDWRNFPPIRQMGDNRCFSMIDEFTSVIGKLITANAFIHGHIDGLVFAEHVAVEKTGTVKGVIFCRTLSVFGKVNANVICDTVVIRDGGAMSSVLKYRSMKIDPGGTITGWFERRDGGKERLAPDLIAGLRPQTAFSV